MPSGDNSFYVDRPEGWNNYGEFIGQELVEVTRKMFYLSHKREDTFIGGLSMGGYGAIRNGLKYHETFGYIAALSSALHIFEKFESKGVTDLAYLESCFGNLEIAKKSDKNPRYIIESNPDVNFPKVYLACGTEDWLLEANRDFRDFINKQTNIKLDYHESTGKHDWIFWDEYIYKVLEWLPLEDSSSGVSSGNVRGE
jgi:S-formylglutathione hydrolase FrmB